MVVLAHFSRRQLASLRNFLDFIVTQANHYVFWFEIGVDNLTHSVHVVQPDEALLGKASDKRQRNTVVVVSFDDFQEIDSKDFKHHYKVLSVGAVMDERIKQLCAMGAL